MLTLPFKPESPRILLYGIDCRFTHFILQGLLDSGANVGGMVLPGPPGVDQPMPVPAVTTSLALAPMQPRGSSVIATLQSHRVPAFRLGDLRSPKAIDAVTSFNADILVCACYPTIIPRAITGLFPGRAVNVHPSLLPDKRGPDPLFWTLREGTGRSGVTIHDLSSRFDAGPILSQRPYTYADGTSEEELEAALAHLAIQMTLELLAPLATGVVQRQRQDEAGTTYARWPERRDFLIQQNMSARAAFNFVRGIERRGVPIAVEYLGDTMIVAEALGYASRAISTAHGARAIELADGYLIARLRTPED